MYALAQEIVVHDTLEIVDKGQKQAFVRPFQNVLRAEFVVATDKVAY